MTDSSPRHWMAAQRRAGHELCVILDSQSERAIRQLLLSASRFEQYASVYGQTAMADLADTGPFIITFDQSGEKRLDELLEHPQRNWGWLASLAKGDLRKLVSHWQERLLIGERPDLALYRFHDNRVLARALECMPVEDHPAYLGPVISACYWQGTHWKTTCNPAPGICPVPVEPGWLRIPLPQPQAAELRRLNTHRYLLAEHLPAYAELAEVRDPDTWLRDCLALAHAWHWHEPQQLEFLLTQSLQAPGHVLAPHWRVRGEETPQEHFERVHQLQTFWQGKEPL